MALADSGRHYEQLTRAERRALVDHLFACDICAQMCVGTMLDYLRDDPRDAMERMAVGLECARRDRDAQDPEALP